MKIRYKILEHERLGDAPFIGALISSIDCHINCGGCFNQHLKLLPTIEEDAKDIINKIKSNPFNKGIIFGGLEWTEQLDEMKYLINLSIKSDLKIMIYTGLNEEQFKSIAEDIYSIPNIYIKFGDFQEKSRIYENNIIGVNLATSNQYIRKTGG